ncbi:hypothetical protein [Rhizobium sullae]|uniref:Lipoprotein n=1 Tax=Rhizobium sullae TaxID=50338 RepID=A0A4R3QE78_RHISU|nr:hypothetical protein [Rhizobium sullae]TCU17912.1 hypothetical protein EV132_10328 [Rhizobium sullae]
MKVIISAFLAAVLLCACTSSGTSEPTPIPGSLTYGGQPRTKLAKSPIGSAVYNNFNDSSGNRVEETYILQPDRSLKLMRQQVTSIH